MSGLSLSKRRPMYYFLHNQSAWVYPGLNELINSSASFVLFPGFVFFMNECLKGNWSVLCMPGCKLLSYFGGKTKNSKQLFSSFYWLNTLKLTIFCIIHHLWIPKHNIFGWIGNSKFFSHIGNLKIAEIENCETSVKEWFDPFVLHYSCFLFFSSIYMHRRYLKKFKY